MVEYYDGTRVLSMKDINGLKPELYLITTNRTGGKTTFFGRMVINRFIKQNKKFCLEYRYNYELDDIADKFFKDIGSLFFPSYNMLCKKKAKGIFCELYLYKGDEPEEDDLCGYAVSINNADAIKKYSHLFSDVEAIIFDEFQSETNHYCTDEIKKFLSVHTSIARGQGKQVRYVPVYMLGNQVSIINPYYVALGISERINKDTKFLKGDGFILENGFIETASRAQKESGINRAFANDSYVSYASENIYLNDNLSFIEKPEGSAKYFGTIRYNGKDFGLWEYTKLGIIYCDNRVDYTFPVKLAVTTEDHQINYVMLKANFGLVQILRYYFEHGCFRFSSLQSKEAVLKCVSY